MLLPSLTASKLPKCFWNESQTFPQMDKALPGQGPACLLDLISSLCPLPGLRDYWPFFQLLRTSSLFPPCGSYSYCPSAQTALLISSLQFSHSAVSDSLRPHESQHSRPPCPSPTPGVSSNSCPPSRWCHPTISCSVSPSPPTFNLSQHQGLFKWVSSLHQVAKVLEFQLQHQSFQWIVRTVLL